MPCNITQKKGKHKKVIVFKFPFRFDLILFKSSSNLNALQLKFLFQIKRIANLSFFPS